MMKELERRQSEQLPFQPKEVKRQIAVTKAAIEYSRRMEEWEKLRVAIDEMIRLQDGFVVWWDGSVRNAGGDKKSAKAKSLSMSDDNDFVSAPVAEKDTGISKQQVSRWRKALEDAAAYHERLFEHEHRKAMARRAAGELIQQSGSNEHYTPQKYIDAARKVLGEIDLDPASCMEANETVRATLFFDQSTDGLQQEWNGRVWLNPPYGDLPGKFIDKLCGEISIGRVTAAIALVNAHCTDTAWFQSLWDGVLCFTNHRINFYGDDDRSGSTHGSVFVYFGDDGDLFAGHFKQFGPIVIKRPTA